MQLVTKCHCVAQWKMVISCSCWCYDLSWASKTWIQFPFSLATLTQKAKDSLEQRMNFLPVPRNGQPGEVRIIFAVLQLLSGGVMKGKRWVSRGVSQGLSSVSFQTEILSGKRTEWVQMSSGEASRSADKTDQNGMPACHRSERRGALHPQHPFNSPQLSDGMEDLSKNWSRFSISHTGLLLPRVLDPLYSEMPSKCDYEAKERKVEKSWPIWESAKLSLMVGVHTVTPALAVSFPLDRRRRRAGQVGCPEPTLTFLTSPQSHLCHLTSGRKATLKRGFIKPIKGEKKRISKCK